MESEKLFRISNELQLQVAKTKVKNGLKSRCWCCCSRCCCYGFCGCCCRCCILAYWSCCCCCCNYCGYCYCCCCCCYKCFCGLWLLWLLIMLELSLLMPLLLQLLLLFVAIAAIIVAAVVVVAVAASVVVTVGFCYYCCFCCLFNCQRSKCFITHLFNETNETFSRSIVFPAFPTVVVVVTFFTLELIKGRRQLIFVSGKSRSRPNRCRCHSGLPSSVGVNLRPLISMKGSAVGQRT